MSKQPARGFRRPPASVKEVESFISGAERRSPPAVEVAQPPPQQHVPQVPQIPPAEEVVEEEALPWEDPRVREDVLKPFNLRPPEPLWLKLKWLSERGPRSMHRIALEAVQEAVEREVEEELAKQSRYGR